MFLCNIEVSVLRMEINQASGDQSVRGARHYDITMGNDITRDAHCDIIISNDVTMDIHSDVTVSNDVAICTYHCITMHNDVAVNLLFCISMPIYVILLWVVCDKNMFMFDQFGQKNIFIDLCRDSSCLL